MPAKPVQGKPTLADLEKLLAQLKAAHAQDTILGKTLIEAVEYQKQTGQTAPWVN